MCPILRLISASELDIQSVSQLIHQKRTSCNLVHESRDNPTPTMNKVDGV